MTWLIGVYVIGAAYTAGVFEGMRTKQPAKAGFLTPLLGGLIWPWLIPWAFVTVIRDRLKGGA